MAPSAVDQAHDASLEAISKPPAGVVLPPKDIRAILEKTAGYVARNGPMFEDRIREKERTNPKFSFLNPQDAYNAFYMWRMDEIRAGRGTDIAAGRVGETGTSAAPAPEKAKAPPEPPEFQFSARMPNISAQDLDIVRLTALFAAKNGRTFITTLSQREARNPQFDFLRPNHSLYSFFSRLMDQYALLMRTGGMEGKDKAQLERLKELRANVDNKFHVLDRAKQRAEWIKFQDSQKQKKEAEEEQERTNYAQIDWHDFVVVETVLFTEADETAELPPPTTLSDLQSASLEQKAMMSLHPSTMRIEEAMPEAPAETPYHPQNNYSPAPTQPNYPSAGAAKPYTPPPIPSSANGTALPDLNSRLSQSQAQPEPPRAQNLNTGTMKIRSDYVPRAAAAAAQRRGNVQMAICPNCNEQIPLDKFEEHQRIELLDPRWKEQRQKAESRSLATNLVPAAAVANLKRLASARSDVFDGSPSAAAAAGGVSAEEEARRKRVNVDQGAQGEGGPSGMGARSIEEQIRNIHEKAAKR